MNQALFNRLNEDGALHINICMFTYKQLPLSAIGVAPQASVQRCNFERTAPGEEAVLTSFFPSQCRDKKSLRSSSAKMLCSDTALPLPNEE